MIKHISTGFNYENKLTFFLEVPFFPNLHSAISSGCLFFRVTFLSVPFFPVPFFPTPAWHMSISPSAGTTVDALLSNMESKCYSTLVFKGKFLLPSANYELYGWKFYRVQIFVSLWLLLLWFKFEDDTPRCINLEWGGHFEQCFTVL